MALFQSPKVGRFTTHGPQSSDSERGERTGPFAKENRGNGLFPVLAGLLSGGQGTATAQLGFGKASPAFPWAPWLHRLTKYPHWVRPQGRP